MRGFKYTEQLFFSAINNTKVRVTLANDAPATVAATDFAITKNVGSTELAITEVLKISGKNVDLRTAAQEAGQVYTIKATATPTATATFTGVPADTTAPRVISASAESNTSAKVVFNEAVDPDTATVVGNYAIAGLTVTAAAMDANDKTGATVILTTSAQTLGTVYTVVVTNVTDLAENKVVAPNNSAQFPGRAPDTTAPALAGTYNAASPLTTLKAGQTSAVRALTNMTVEIIFNEKVDVASAQTTSNYVIPGLAVNEATVWFDTVKTGGVTDVYDGRKVVLNTAAQTLGTVYNLTITNVKDLAGNAIAAPGITAPFAGKGADTTAPNSVTATTLTNTTVKLVFNEALEKESAETVANYTIPGLTISKAELKAHTDGEMKRVDLTTSAQTLGSVYKVTVVGVKDLAGNAIAAPGIAADFAGKGADTTAPAINTVVANYNAATGITTVVVTFNEDVEKASAEAVTNYNINKGIGYPIQATLSTTDAKVVTLRTNAQTPGEIYTLTVSGVKDLSGNAIAATPAVTKTFNGAGQLVTAGPKIASVTPIDKKTIQVTFDKAVTNSALTEGNYELDGVALTGAPTDAVWFTDTTKTKVTIRFAADKFTDNTIYKLRIKDIADVAGNIVQATTFADTAGAFKQFGGSSVEFVAPKVVSVTPLDNKNIVVNFNQPVVGTTKNEAIFTSTAANFQVTLGATTLNGSAVAYYNNDKSKVKVTFGTALEPNSIYTFKILAANLASVKDLGALINLAPNTPSTDATVTFGTTEVVATAPVLQSAAPINVDTIALNFSAPIVYNVGTPATDITVTAVAPGTGAWTTAYAKVNPSNPNQLLVYSSNATGLKPGEIYNVVVATAQVKGANGETQADATKFQKQMGGTDVANPQPELTSVQVLSANKLKLTFNEPVASAAGTLLADVDKTKFTLKGATIKTAGEPGTALTALNQEGTEYALEFTGTDLWAGHTYTLETTVANIKDIAGKQTLKPTTAGGTVKTDTIAGVKGVALTATGTNNGTDKVDIAATGPGYTFANTHIKIFETTDFGTNGLGGTNLYVTAASPGTDKIIGSAVTGGKVTLTAETNFTTTAAEYYVIVTDGNNISNILTIKGDASKNLQMK